MIACEGAAALRLQHETGEIIDRVNGFLGFGAIARIRIVQKPVAPARVPARPAPRPLSDLEQSRLARAVSGIDDSDLRRSLEQLGRSVTGRRR